MATENLPAIPFDVARMAAALHQSARESVPSASFLRMDKSGTWIFGVDAEEIEDHQQFLVNPGGFGRGYVCWTDDSVQVSAKLGESYLPLMDPLPECGAVPPTGRGWEFQLGLALRGYKGTQDGVEMVYRTSSVGGKRAVAALSKLVGTKLNAYVANNKDDEIVPLVTLGCDSYPHKKYGKIYVPEFTIVKWVKMPTGASPAAQQAEAERKVAAPKRNGKRR